MNKATTTSAAMVLGLVLAAGPAWAAGPAKDTEQIIDVAKISKAVRESTAPLYEALDQTQLKQRFEEVQTMLRGGKVNRQELLGSLKQLKGSIDDFTGKWESIVEPLWSGQETLGKAIESIRRKVPPPGEGDMPVKVRKLLDNYDLRLHELAGRIKRTKDPVAAKRLKKVFQNLLSLRQFTERLGRAGVEKTKVRLMLRTVQVLSRLQDQLMDATFELEKVRSILARESEFINDYVELLQMARTANELVAMLRSMRVDGAGLGGVAADVGNVRRISGEVAEGLQNFSKSIIDDLDGELDKMAREMAESAAADSGDGVEAAVNVDVEIDKYLTWEVVESKIVIE